MSKYFPEPNSVRANVKVELHLSNYATNAELKNANGVDTSSFAKNVPTNLSNLKSKVHKSDVDKLVPVPLDLSKLSDAVKNDVVKKMYIMLR